MQINLSFIMLIVMGVILLAIFLANLHRRQQREAVAPTLGDIHIVEDALSKIETFEPRISPANFNILDSIIEPMLGDPVLETVNVSGESLLDHVSFQKTTLIEAMSKDNVTVTIDKKLSKSEVSDLLVIHVMATQSQQFFGYELLQALLALDMRYGEMNIFHRYETTLGQGKKLFSVASAMEPGIFDINKMGGFSCPGLSLFMRLKEQSNPEASFELMLETARQLADDLGGEVCDGQRRLLTDDILIHYKEQARLASTLPVSDHVN